MAGAAAATAAAWPLRPAAASQIEEPLADSVRHALRAAVEFADPLEPEFASTEARMAYLRWLTQISPRLARRLSYHTVCKNSTRSFKSGLRRAGLDESLVLGLIQVESGFRQFAISVVGARGYMQIMPFWARLIGDGDVGGLFHLKTNLRFGCVILRHYLDRERGDLFMALGRYNGSRGRSPYPNAVFAAQRRWQI